MAAKQSTAKSMAKKSNAYSVAKSTGYPMAAKTEHNSTTRSKIYT
jgi:hypothetical protein